LLCYIPAIKKFVKHLSKQWTKVYNAIKQWQENQYDSFKEVHSRPEPWVKGKLEIAAKLSLLICFAFTRVFLWLLKQLFSIQSNDGFYALYIVCYIAFAGWNMGDIIDLKLNNAHLLESSEEAWGFGQVLSMALLGMIVFNVVDAFKGERSCLVKIL
jgi:hypothetical protein